MSLFRKNIQELSGYVPGEQPQDTGWVKLNTNENPYPPSEKVIEAICETAEHRLHIYPDALATPFRIAVSNMLQIDPDWILPANGSDENLTILLRTFVDPGEQVAYPYPSYVLYETLAQLQAAHSTRIALNVDWSWNWEATEPIVSNCKMMFVPNPNSPSGNRWSAEEILRLVPPSGLLVLDEAYGDFCDDPHQAEIFQHDLSSRIVVTRTLSKSYSLAGLRFGYAIAHPDLIAGMRKVKDSYNCDSLSIAAAVAAIQNRSEMLNNVKKIQSTRSRLMSRLRELEFNVVESQTNFVWATHPSGAHQRIYENLKAQKILIRYMQFPGFPNESDSLDGLRITVGTDIQVEQFLDTLTDLL